MRAVILAAGFGTRLGGLGARGAKALLPVGPRRAIDWSADAAEAVAAVRGVDVVTNDVFHDDLARWAAARAARPGAAKPLRLWNDGRRSVAERRGAIGDLAWWLRRARPRAPVLVLASDNVFDFSLAPLADAARREPTVVLHDVGSRVAVRRLASASVDDAGHLTGFREKDPEPASTVGCVALYGLPPATFPEVHAYLEQGGSPDNLGFFIEWLHARTRVRGLELRGRWVDVGSPEDYRRAVAEFG